MRAKIVDQLAEAIGVLLREQKGPMLKITGPGDLLTALQDRLSPISAEFDYSFNESVDDRIAADETVIELQLAEFAARIESNRE